MFLDRISLSLRQLLINKKIIIFFGVLVLILITAFSLYFLILKSSALNTQGISDYSTIKTTEATNYFILQKDKGYLYKSQKEGIDAVNDFIKLNPSFNKTKLLPQDFDKNSSLGRSAKDSEDPFLKKRNINLTNEHYFIDQKINGIPIYGAQLAVHLKNKNEIYSVSGNLVTNKETTKQKLSDAEATEIALSEAQKGENFELKVGKTSKSIINLRLLGASSDETNYLTLAVEIDSKNLLPFYSKIFYVDLASGRIVWSTDLIQDAINRKMYDCNGSTSCPLSRGEGSLPTGIADVDRAYDIYGEVYYYYLNNFQRDGPDDQGSPLNAYVNAPSSVVQANCPNASADWTTLTMAFCPGMVTRDIVGHELTHTVTGRTAGLEYKNQSGALNESISDIFGSAIDNNWTVGEGSAMGIGRDMSNPPAKGDPDSLFSNYYWCSSGDKGGVHTNSGVLNKAFYLMTDGGNFNSCSVNGIGRDKSHTVIYQALTRYLSPTSNFKSMYNSVLQACNDLYPGSSECENTKAAFQATEMDQQPDADQLGAYCQGLQPNPPACAGGVAPTNPPITPNTSPTSGPTSPPGTPVPYSISGNVFADTNENNQKDIGEGGVQGVILNLVGPLNTTTDTDTNGDYSFPSLVEGTYTITATFAGQSNSGSVTLTSSYPQAELNFGLISGEGPIPVPPTGTPTITPGTGGGGTTPKVTPSPTPVKTYTCREDTKATKAKPGSIKIGSLICEPN